MHGPIVIFELLLYRSRVKLFTFVGLDCWRQDTPFV